MATVVGLVAIGYLNRNEPVVAELADRAGLVQPATTPDRAPHPPPTAHHTGPHPPPASVTTAEQTAPKQTTPKQPRVKPQQLRVVTLNEFRRLDLAQARADADRVSSLPGVDIIGWQEGYDDGRVYGSLADRGWATKRFARGSRELAVSWRRSRFALVGASQIQMGRGYDRYRAQYPFGDTYMLRVTLRERATGLLLTVIDTHLPHKIEDLSDPGHWTHTANTAQAKAQLVRMGVMWANAPGRWVIGTGDYNFDARADERVHTAGAPTSAFNGHAVSNYQALGFAGMKPTHPYTGRYLDYVHVAQRDIGSGRVRFVGQRTVSGLNSDHRAVAVRLSLR